MLKLPFPFSRISCDVSFVIDIDDEYQWYSIQKHLKNDFFALSHFQSHIIYFTDTRVIVVEETLNLKN